MCSVIHVHYSLQRYFCQELKVKMIWGSSEVISLQYLNFANALFLKTLLPSSFLVQLSRQVRIGDSQYFRIIQIAEKIKTLFGWLLASKNLIQYFVLISIFYFYKGKSWLISSLHSDIWCCIGFKRHSLLWRQSSMLTLSLSFWLCLTANYWKNVLRAWVHTYNKVTTICLPTVSTFYSIF